MDEKLKMICFDWDENNIFKNEIKHKVYFLEAEEIFFNKPLTIDKTNFKEEIRYVALGITKKKRKLCIIFTLRLDRIRIISARDQSKKERKVYSSLEFNSNHMSQIKKLPKFKNEDEERDFWVLKDATDYFDFKKPTKIDFSSLKPSSKSITLRVPESLLKDLKMIANRQDVPYQSLMKIYLQERVAKELRI